MHFPGTAHFPGAHTRTGNLDGCSVHFFWKSERGCACRLKSHSKYVTGLLTLIFYIWKHKTESPTLHIAFSGLSRGLNSGSFLLRQTYLHEVIPQKTLEEKLSYLLPVSSKNKWDTGLLKWQLERGNLNYGVKKKSCHKVPNPNSFNSVNLQAWTQSPTFLFKEGKRYLLLPWFLFHSSRLLARMLFIHSPALQHMSPQKY
jgi:hypothetical protein